jgi:hypothetical protein
MSPAFACLHGDMAADHLRRHPAQEQTPSLASPYVSPYVALEFGV